MPRKSRNTVILAKIETTVGTDAVPTGAANALLVSNQSFSYSINNVDRNNIRPYMGASEQLAGTRSVQISFDIEMSGSGAAGTAPAWGPLLQACAFAEVVTAGQRVEYNPISTGFKSLTIYYYRDGVAKKLLGAMGNVQMMAEEGQIPKFRFTFTGVDGGVSASANPAATLTAWKTPKVVNNDNSGKVTLGATYATGALTGGTEFCSKGVTLDAGNQVSFLSMLGPCSGVDITDRSATGSLTIDLDAAAEVTAITDVLANNLTSVGLVHGTVAGAKVLLFAPAAQRINPQEVDSEGRAHNTFDLRLTPVSGNDELRIVSL
jgi:Phage tail tube protein